MKDTLLNIRVKQETVEDLNKLSDFLDVPYSQIVREAIKEKIEKLTKDNPQLVGKLSNSLALSV